MTVPRFLRLSNSVIAKDGSQVCFTVEASGASPLTVEVKARDLEHIIRHLTMMAIDAGKNRGGVRSFAEKQVDALPIQAEQIGLMPGSKPDSVFFVVRIAELDIAYEFPIEQVRGLAQSFGLIAATLESTPKSVN